MPFIGLFWFIVVLVPLVFLQRLLHREIQALFLIVTRSPYLTHILFSALFFPGVFLHELSHFLMAKLLNVRTGKMSFIPTPLPNGRLRLGYVETAQADIVRDSLIGLAPLITGSLFVAFAGIWMIRLDVIWHFWLNRYYSLIPTAFQALPQMPYFYIWAYLIFAVSSTMMPSESDRHAWLPLGLWLATLLALAISAGAGTWMVDNLAPVMDSFFGSVAPLFGLSVIVHILLMLPALMLHRVASRITGLDVK